MSILNDTTTPTTDKEFFDWLRNQQHNQRLSQQMVDGANELLALLGADALKTSLAKLNNWQTDSPAAVTVADSHTNTDSLQLQLSDNGAALINEFEGFSAVPYRDVVGKPTIGYGNTYYLNADGSRRAVTLQDPPLSQAEAAELKKAVINADFAPAINLMFADEIAQGKLRQNHFDALVSLAYNIGVRGLQGSSVYRHIKAGDMTAAANAFLLWNKGRVNGRLTVIKGLANRRSVERQLFLT